MSDLLIAGAVIDGAGPLDVRVRGGVIDQIDHGIVARPGEAVLRAGGGELMVGLHDHHVHLRATAAAAGSVMVGPPEVTGPEQFASVLADAARQIRPGGWIRAVGYHDSVAGRLDASILDALVPTVPVRVQHRSGAEWVLNTVGLERLGVADLDDEGVDRDAGGRPTGRLFRLDRWLGERLGPTSLGRDAPDSDAPDSDVLDLDALSRRAAGFGVTGFTEATPDLTPADLAQLADVVTRGSLLQRLCVMCPPGVFVPAHPRLTRGPAKVLLDDATIPMPDDLAARLGELHRSGSAVAVHCVTRLQLVVTLLALEACGTVPGDRIEHGGIIPAESIDDLARLGLTVVTNPGFVAERGEQYLVDVEPAELPDLYRCASLRAGGVAVAAGSDAPFGPLDPWVAIQAAVDRRTRSGSTLGPGERLSPATARSLFSGRADRPGDLRRVAVGEPGDLCLIGGRASTSAPGTTVLATVVDGTVIYER